jgi:FixJ family two-component response regulator
MPIVFITGYGDVPTSVRAMKRGAVDFLPKPFDAKALMQAVRQSIAKDAWAREQRAEIDAIHARLGTLTPREAEVLFLVVRGRLNKQIAHELGIAEKTVKLHRGRVMEKMRVGSVADLVRLTEKVGKASPKS